MEESIANALALAIAMNQGTQTIERSIVSLIVRLDTRAPGAATLQTTAHTVYCHINT